MIKFIKQVANLWRIRKNPTAYEKGILMHLNVNPAVRAWANRFHGTLPIGKAENVRIEDGALKATIKLGTKQ